MRLKSMPRPTEALTRKFYFVPEGAVGIRLEVECSYLSPSLFQEQSEKSKVKVIAGRRTKETVTPDLDDFRKAMAEALLIKAVHRITNVTFDKLRSLVNLDPKFVADNGGMDAAIPMDPAVISEEDQKAVSEGKMSQKEAEARARDLAQENIIWLLQASPEFFNWTLNVVTSLEYYQDDDWEEQVENLRNGQATSSVAA